MLELDFNSFIFLDWSYEKDVKGSGSSWTKLKELLNSIESLSCQDLGRCHFFFEEYESPKYSNWMKRFT